MREESDYLYIRKKVTDVVELDNYKLQLTAFKKPLTEMGDSL